MLGSCGAARTALGAKRPTASAMAPVRNLMMNDCQGLVQKSVMKINLCKNE